MNPIADEMKQYIGSAEMTDEEFIRHYGMPRRSGRYPYGSGENPYQHEDGFLGRLEKLKKKGWTETKENIRKEFGMSQEDFRKEKSIALDDKRIADIDRVKSLYSDGYKRADIARIMGKNESTIRELENADKEQRTRLSRETASFIKNKMKEKKLDMVDVGPGTAQSLGITENKLGHAVKILEHEGYNLYSGRIPQPTNVNQATTQKVLCAPGIKEKEIYDYSRVGTLNDYVSKDGGITFEKKFTYPSSMSSKRIQVRYADDKGPDGFTGLDKDGTVEIRRGVQDLDLKGSRYAQIRILVDGTHYIKGMAVYSDNMPDGVDLVFNTNKKRGTPLLSDDPKAKQVLKPIKNDPDNPFGSLIKDADQGGQYWYTDKKTGEKKLGLINKRSDQGDWTEWADKLPSQFLSKQSKQLAQKQLDLAKANANAAFDDIMSLNNNTVKKYYLKKFADQCDSDAADLKAAALPGQKYHVIIPINTLKDNEVYAPQYRDGTKLALIRYPHAGTFEIPKLTVNNKNALANKIIGSDSIDGIGITKNVADRLSGADFDGDTVMCIPTDDRKGKVRIQNRDELPGLKGFDNKLEYGSEVRVNSKGQKEYYSAGRKIVPLPKSMVNKEMGVISNLITDMTLTGGASDDELARAVRHSMVIIDAEKHKLDYRRSYIENNIAELKNKYQTKYDAHGNPIGGGGASTIISRSKGQLKIPKVKGQPRINIRGKDYYDPNRPEGAYIYKTAPDKELYYPIESYDKKTGARTITTTSGKTITYNMYNKTDRDKYAPVLGYDKDGKVQFTNKSKTISYKYGMRQTDSTNMKETDDARTLMSKNPHPMEIIYADYANSMKALANKARKTYVTTKDMEYNRNAATIYKDEVSSLNIKLNNAEKNAVRERAAMRIANVNIKNKKALDPDMSKKDLKKLNQQEMTRAREEVNSIARKKRSINITDKEWAAIQAGAITKTKLNKILDNSDPDILRERAMPKEKKTISTAQIARIKALSASNFTLKQIADATNLSASTISKILKGES